MARGRPASKLTGSLSIVAAIEPTRDLDEAEAEKWDRWLEVVKATRPFLSTDPPLLTSLSELECRLAKAKAILKKIPDPYEDGKRHPALTDIDNAHRDYMALLRELGLTPASAKNVRSEKRTPEGDKLATFLGAK